MSLNNLVTESQIKLRGNNNGNNNELSKVCKIRNSFLPTIDRLKIEDEGITSTIIVVYTHSSLLPSHNPTHLGR